MSSERPSKPTGRAFPRVFDRVGRINDGEWYRLKLAVMAERVDRADHATPRDGAYTHPDELAADLALLDRSLCENFGRLLAEGRLARVRRLVATIGFHLAVLDIRQHADKMHDSLGKLFTASGTAYPDDEAGRTALLVAELGSRRPLAPAGTPVDEGDAPRCSVCCARRWTSGATTSSSRGSSR